MGGSHEELEGVAAPGGAWRLGELRTDRLTGRVAVRVPTWTGKPRGDAGRPLAVEPGACAFCPPGCYDPVAGNPFETGRLGPGEPNQDGWHARSLANRWPLLPASQSGAATDEVVVLSPHHGAHFGAMSASEAAGAFAFLLDRARAVTGAGRPFPIVYVNHGRLAGASQSHPHGHVAALADTPASQRAEASALGAASCVLCDEGLNSDLEVTRSEGLSLWSPWAPTVAWEQRLTSLGHEPWPNDPAAAGRMVRRAVRALEAVVGPVAYNLLIHLGPACEHWHVHIVPRLAVPGGLELGSDLWPCPADPEEFASRLRLALPGVGHPEW